MVTMYLACGWVCLARIITPTEQILHKSGFLHSATSFETFLLYAGRLAFFYDPFKLVDIVL